MLTSHFRSYFLKSFSILFPMILPIFHPAYSSISCVFEKKTFLSSLKCVTFYALWFMDNENLIWTNSYASVALVKIFTYQRQTGVFMLSQQLRSCFSEMPLLRKTFQECLATAYSTEEYTELRGIYRRIK